MLEQETIYINKDLLNKVKVEAKKNHRTISQEICLQVERQYIHQDEYDLVKNYQKGVKNGRSN